MQVKDISVGKKYTTKNGEEKIRWVNVGHLFIKDDGRMAIKFEDYINPIAFKNEKGEVWFNVFDPKAENASKTNQSSQPYTEPTQEEKERVMADGRAYSSKWREQAQSAEYEPDGCEVDGEMF